MNSTRYIVLNLFGLILLLSSVATGSQGKEEQYPKANNAIYWELAGFLVVGTQSINYEHLLMETVAIRTGFVVGYNLIEHDGQFVIGAFGPLAMVNYLSEGNNKLELGAGVSFISNPTYRTYDYFGQRLETGNWMVVPAFTIGYRHQNRSGGFLFRIGLNYGYFFGTPFQIGFGVAF